MVKLTKYAGKGGCACKLGPQILAKVLDNVKTVTNAHVLADMTGSDDAGIYQISSHVALVQTLDFFTPIVDDPYLFGQIAAANSLSDIYAMGGRPITTMNIVAFPIPLVEAGALEATLNGAMDVLADTEAAAIGGHSIENDVPLFGMSVTGLINPQDIWTNKGAHVGDGLVLTKPIGTGLMSNALKGGLFDDGVEEAIISMRTLNKLAAQIAKSYSIHACTDITGFSLIGHSMEMAQGAQCSIEIDTKALPLFSHVLEAAEMGLIPAATYGNQKSISGVVFSDHLDDVWKDVCFDPQTSGGLLLALPLDQAFTLVEDFHKVGLGEASLIGCVKESGDYKVFVK